MGALTEALNEADEIVSVSQDVLSGITSNQLIAAFLLLSFVGDTWTTKLAIDKYGKEAEKNPVMKRIFNEYGFTNGVLGTKFIIHGIGATGMYAALRGMGADNLARALAIYLFGLNAAVVFGNVVQLSTEREFA